MQKPVSMQLGCVILHIDVFTHLQALRNPTTPSHRHDQLLIPSPAPLPSLKNAEWGFSTSSFSSWLDVSGDQSPSWSPLRVTSLEQQMS